MLFRSNQKTNPHETSWGVSTRLIGGIIMTHGDNNGLVLPPKVAPIQAIILPIAQHKPGVLDAANAIKDRLIEAGIRAKLDDLEQAVAEQLGAVHQGMYERAKKNLEDHIFEAHSVEEAKELQEKNGGYIKTMWCGELECELKMKEVAGMSSRCMPFAQEKLDEVCPCCGKPAQKMVYWGVAY